MMFCLLGVPVQAADDRSRVVLTSLVGSDSDEPQRFGVIQIGPVEARGGISAVIGSILHTGVVQAGFNVITVNSSMYRDAPAWHEFGVIGRALFELLKSGLVPANRVVHLHASYGVSFYRKALFMVVSKLLGKRVIFHIHSGRVNEFYCTGKARKWIVGLVLRHSDVVVVLAPTFAEQLARTHGLTDCRVISNPLTVPISGNVAGSRGTPTIVLFMGFWIKEKGLRELIEAMRMVAQHHDVCLRVCGKGPMDGFLGDLADDNDWLSLVGWVEGDERDKELAQADLLVLPSYFEGVPMVLLEGMANGLPCIATRVGGVPSLITDGVDGILVESGNIAALAEALALLVSSPELRAEMARAAQARARKHLPEVIARQWMDLYDALG